MDNAAPTSALQFAFVDSKKVGKRMSPAAVITDAAGEIVGRISYRGLNRTATAFLEDAIGSILGEENVAKLYNKACPALPINEDHYGRLMRAGGAALG